MNFIMIGLLLREALDRLRVRLNMYLVCSEFMLILLFQVNSKRLYLLG